MGLLSWLQRKAQEEVPGTRVLVCALGADFDDLLKVDSEIWTRYYESVTIAQLASIGELSERISRCYDVVHLFCHVSPRGEILDGLGGQVQGTDLIAACCRSGVKLLWFGSGSKPEAYVNGFKAKGKPINLVLTIDRQGLKAQIALDKLLSRLSTGDRMPIAWVKLWPQVPGLAHPDAPEAIFFSGRPGVVLLK